MTWLAFKRVYRNVKRTTVFWTQSLSWLREN